MLTYGTVNNTYNRDILTAAKRLCEAGYSSWKYETHYSSGTTCWSTGSAAREDVVLMHNGEISKEHTGK